MNPWRIRGIILQFGCSFINELLPDVQTEAQHLKIGLRLLGLRATFQFAFSLLLLLLSAGCEGWVQPWSRGGLLFGRVVDLEGRPLKGVALDVAHHSTTSRSDGHFQLFVPSQPSWLRARARGFLPSLRPVVPGSLGVVRLSSDDGHTLVIRAGGDVMAGRRFYAPEPGSRQRPLLALGDQLDGHRRLLEPVRPLLAQAHLTLLNLETPLLADPIGEIRGQRSSRFHATKDFVFASAPGLAMALRDAGVDVLGLANNHLYDALELGLQSTLAVLEDAGFHPGVGYFGAGFTPNQAWQPAQLRRGDQLISALGCTTIHGAQHPISYIASTQQAKGERRCVNHRGLLKRFSRHADGVR